MSIKDIEDSIPLSRKPKNIKYYNQRLILSLLKNHEVLAASEISERINLSITSVTKILTALQKKKLIKSMGKGNSTEEGGKKPELFALNDTYKYVISVYSGRNQIECAIATLKCRIVDTINFPYRIQEDFESCMKDMSDAIQKLVEANGLKPEDICGLAVGFDGIVDSACGILLFPIHNTFWGRNLPVKEILQEKLPGYRNITIDNGCRLSGYAELLSHSEYTSESVLIISSGSTTGGCVLDHGNLMQGANGFVGEVGHITVDPSNRAVKCTCGNYGCFETMITPTALLNYAKERQEDYPGSLLIPLIKNGNINIENIFQASNESDTFGCKIIDHVITYFSILIRNIVLIYDPGIIVLQGFYTMAGPYFIETLQKEIYSIPFFKIKKELKIEYSNLPVKQGLFIGGALYSVDRYFSGYELFSE